jgi:hypothetical protein
MFNKLANIKDQISYLKFNEKDLLIRLSFYDK